MKKSTKRAATVKAPKGKSDMAETAKSNDVKPIEGARNVLFFQEQTIDALRDNCRALSLMAAHPDAIQDEADQSAFLAVIRQLDEIVEHLARDRERCLEMIRATAPELSGSDA
jgi:hypothetical protein